MAVAGTGPALVWLYGGAVIGDGTVDQPANSRPGGHADRRIGDLGPA